MPPKRNPLNLNPLQLKTLTLLQALAGKNDRFEQLAAPSRVEIARGGKVTKPLEKNQ